MLISDEKASRTSEGTLDAPDRRTKDLEAEQMSADPIPDQDLIPPASEQGEQKVDGDVLIVEWEGPDDPANPRNWPFRTKWAGVAIVSAFTFISPVVSSMIAPASEQVASEFRITSMMVIAMTTSVFVCAFGVLFFTNYRYSARTHCSVAIGPLILSPLSEIFGRSRVLQLANLWFLGPPRLLHRAHPRLTLH
ncbi:hypothetical protein EWM64_g8683 [Hericium alpestre]|uniref:Major facilitator superfamily (MFS) profile domain-containing protein n=1 Tax=Hericium alpestre TaxID=135208 RepID=A0A4Y9ZNB1_9AGAM|nr:hypothetical protein EWM64_g8683 [Hericium alpestre]